MRSPLSILIFVLAALLSSTAHAQTGVTPEEVKAAFLLRFAGFVEWPAKARASNQLVIGVIEADEVEQHLQRYAAVRNEDSQAPIVRSVATPTDLAGLHILFIGTRDPARLTRWINAARSLPVLIVTDSSEGLERGSMINFITTDRVQFEAAADAATRAGLRLSPRLLSVATRVKKGSAEGLTLLARSRRGAGVPS